MAAVRMNGRSWRTNQTDADAPSPMQRSVT
jgi:hypothetical protein